MIQMQVLNSDPGTIEDAVQTLKLYTSELLTD